MGNEREREREERKKEKHKEKHTRTDKKLGSWENNLYRLGTPFFSLSNPRGPEKPVPVGRGGGVRVSE